MKKTAMRTYNESLAVLVHKTLPVQRHQESGRLDHDERVGSQIGSLFAGRQMATHSCNLVEGVVLLTMEHDTHQKVTLRSNSTDATFIKPALPVHTHSGRVTSSARGCHTSTVPHNRTRSMCIPAKGLNNPKMYTATHHRVHSVFLIDHHGEAFHALGHHMKNQGTR